VLPALVPLQHVAAQRSKQGQVGSHP
jgi:hypothetical protein